MPDVRISELPAAASPADADLAPLVQTSGATRETRRATVAQLRSAVLADRGAHVRDYGAVGDGVTDDAPFIQAAINDLKTKGGGTLSFGPRVYRIASAIVLSDATIRLQGAGFTEGPSPAQGTWLKIDTTGFTPSPSPAPSPAAPRCATSPWRSPTPRRRTPPGCRPTTTSSFGWRTASAGSISTTSSSATSPAASMRGIPAGSTSAGCAASCCAPASRSTSATTSRASTAPISGPSGAATTTSSAGSRPMPTPWSSAAATASSSTRPSRSATAACSASPPPPAASPAKFYIGQAYADFCQYGVWIEANNTDGQIANLTHQGEIFNAGGPPLAGGSGILINASNTRVQAANLRIDAVEDNAVRIAGSGNRLDVFSLRCVRYNYRNNGATAIALADSGAAAANQLYLGSPPLLEGGNGGALANTSTNGTVALGAPAGRAARPGLALGSTDTGLFQPTAGALAAAAGGAELLRASAGAMTLGAVPGSHALEVATPPAAANRLVVTGGGTGAAVAVQAQGADANVDLTLAGKGSGLVRGVTAAAGDTSTALATTAWVRAQGYATASAGGGIGAVSSVAGRTGDVVLTTADIGGFGAAAAAAAPVASVAGRTGAVTLTSADIGGFGAAAAVAAPVASVAGRTGAVSLGIADVAGAAPLASPAFTGSPTAPTPAVTDSSTALATTAWAWSRPAQRSWPMPPASAAMPVAPMRRTGRAPAASPARSRRGRRQP
ncbi:glycosyl hydrolase family 28-related protein [Dankookia sp. P2]|uniref:glycosyl hydrolase family 28-related protein n=1 Tax=Dankookia sp. P2 TaxID=3423955 RepID=UPI003D66C3A1